MSSVNALKIIDSSIVLVFTKIKVSKSNCLRQIFYLKNYYMLKI